MSPAEHALRFIWAVSAESDVPKATDCDYARPVPACLVLSTEFVTTTVSEIGAISIAEPDGNSWMGRVRRPNIPIAERLGFSARTNSLATPPFGGTGPTQPVVDTPNRLPENGGFSPLGDESDWEINR